LGFLFLYNISKTAELIRDAAIAINKNKPITNLPNALKPSVSTLYMVIKLYTIKGNMMIAGIYFIYLILLKMRFNIQVTRIETTDIIAIINTSLIIILLAVFR